MVDIITQQAIPLDILITSIYELHLQKIFKMVDTISNMQLADLKSKPHSGKSLRYLIDRAIGVRFYTPPESEHYKLLQLDQFHGTPHINDNHRNNNETKLEELV